MRYNGRICCDNEFGARLIGGQTRTAGIHRCLYYAFFMAIMTGALAQIRVQLPWTPVPLTGQTIAVLVSGYLLGRWWGGVSQLIYLVGGVGGIPWFSEWKGGLAVFSGPTSGYLIGFVLAALFMGEAFHRMRKPTVLKIVVTTSAANFILIYIPGLIQLRAWVANVNGADPSVPDLLRLGALPFVFHDLLKISFCSSLIYHCRKGRPANFGKIGC